MSFDYQISADASNALRASQEVEKSLERVLAANKGVGDSFEKEAKRSADAMGRALATAQQRATDLHNQLTSFRGFEALGQQFQRETELLDRMHAPMRQYQQDLASLDGLYRRNAISAQEYWGELDKLKAKLKETEGGGSLSGNVAKGVTEATGFPALLAGGAAGVAATLTSKAIEAGGSALQLSEAYTNLDNRLRKLTDDEDERAKLMTRTKDIANASRSEWAATGELFVRLSSATKDMNLGQDRTLRLTETISKAFAMSGASASESAGAMLQLSQAFASGHLQGDEFRSLAEAMPDIMDRIAQTMHVSRSELKQLGTDGKITSDILVASFENSANDIAAKFGKTAPTLSQSWTIFKNEMTEVVGKLVKDTDLLPTVASAFKSLAESIGTVASAIHKATEAWEAWKKFTGSGKEGDNTSDALGGAGHHAPIPGIGGVSRFDPAGLSDIPGKVKDIFSGKAFDVSDEEMRKTEGIWKSFRESVDHTGDSIDMIIAKQIAQAAVTRDSVEVQGAANQKISETVNEIRGQMTPALAEQGERWAQSIGLATTAADTLTSYLDRVMKVTDALKNQWSPANEQQKKDWNDIVKSVTDGTSSWGDFVDKSDKADTPHKNMLRLVDAGKQLVKAFEQIGTEAGALFDTTTMSNTDALVDNMGQLFTSLQAIHNLNKQDRDTTDEIVEEVTKWDDALDGVKSNAGAILGDFSKTAMVLPDLARKAVEFIALKKGDPWFNPPKTHGLSIEQKLLEDILGPMRDYKLETHALDDLLKRHIITTQQYSTELDKLTRKLGEAGVLMANFFKEAERGSRPSKPKGVGGGIQFNPFLEEPAVFNPDLRGESDLAKPPVSNEELVEFITNGPRAWEIGQRLAREKMEMIDLSRAQHTANIENQPDLQKELALEAKITEQTIKWKNSVHELAEKHDLMAGFKKGLTEIYNEVTDIATTTATTLTNTFHNLEDVLINAANSGKFAWGSFLTNLGNDLAKLALRILEMRLLMAAFGGGFGGTASVFGTGATQAFTGLYGGGHATGGSYVVPGSGPPDSRLVMFKMTPGERADFTPQGSARGGGAGNVTVINRWDHREMLAALDTDEGHRVIRNAIGRNAAAFGSVLGR